MTVLKAGAVVYIGPDASVQFRGQQPFSFEVSAVRAGGWRGWVWLDGWQILPSGVRRRREIYVRVAGLVSAGVGVGGR